MKKFSKYVGVHWHNKTGRWRAVIHVNKKQYSLRYHDTEEQAAEVYNKFIIENDLNYPLNEIIYT